MNNIEKIRKFKEEEFQKLVEENKFEGDEEGQERATGTTSKNPSTSKRKALKTSEDSWASSKDSATRIQK